jgi:hypothetical protein
MRRKQKESAGGYLFTVSEVVPGVFKLWFKTQKEMNETLIRIQEYYESPEFAGKLFTLGQFRQWYSGKYGKFDYIDQIVGTNMPNSALEPFKTGLFDPLSDGEKKVLEYFGNKPGNFYLIGTYGDSESALEHEITHGLFYTNEKYKAAVLAYLKKNNSKKWLKEVKVWLKEKGYNDATLLDEVNAWLTSDRLYIRENYPDLEVPDKIYNEIKAIRIKHCGM